MTTQVRYLVRNQEIYDAHKSGVTVKVLAERAGITSCRIRQIIERVQRREDWFKKFQPLSKKEMETEHLRQISLAQTMDYMYQLLRHQDGYRFLRQYDEFMDAFDTFDRNPRPKIHAEI